MKMTGVDIAVRALEDEGIPFTFGIPGTHNIELYDSLIHSKVQPILVTDEQSASFMADAVSRSSGKLGVANVVPGAGLTHALSGIAEAWLDGIPMLVLACGIRRDSGGKSFQLHDVDQIAIAAPITKAQFLIKDGSEIYTTIRRACQIARAAPAGPVIVEVPVDLYLFRHEARLDAPPDLFPATTSVRPEELERAVAMLNVSPRPLLYLGLGAAGAGVDLVALAERLEAPVATTFQGKGVFPENHPLWLWCGFGTAAPSFVRKTAESCDMTLAIGCRFAEVGTGSYGLQPPGKMIHVDVDAGVLGRNYPAAVPIISDAGRFVSALLPRLTAKPSDSKLRQEIAAGHAEVQAVAIECLRLDRPRSFLAPIDYSCMGYAVPSALGAAFACPDRPVAALVGDGAFLMTGLELLTAAHNKLPVMILVLRDRELAQISQFQQTALGSKVCSELPDYDLSAICRGVEIQYLALRHNSEIEAVLIKARAITQTERPVVVEVEIDYSEKTYFTKGVVKTTFGRLPWPDRLRMLFRAVTRKIG